MMLSTDKHCEMLTDQIRDRVSNILDAFKLYVQLFSAIAGGSVVLGLQTSRAIPPSFQWLSDGLALLVVVVCTIMIWEHLRGWRDYRQRLSEVAGYDAQGKQIIPPPSLKKSTKLEMMMIAVMIISWLIFALFNPLRH